MSNSDKSGKRVMLLVNPQAGRRLGEKNTPKIVNMFAKRGFNPTVFRTSQKGDELRIIKESARSFDMVVCVGGDGTLNGVLNGILSEGVDIPLGYIPTGSTNDFARSLNLPSKPKAAVDNIVDGESRRIDAGKFDDTYFSYVASFGLFTRTSYTTPQKLKNIFGHSSYVIQGAKELTQLRTEHLSVEANGQKFEGSYVFGAISNSKSIGGIMKYSDSMVDLSDGKLEMMLIRKPDEAGDWVELLHCLNHQQYDNKYIDFCHAESFRLKAVEGNLDWSLDGEYHASAGEFNICCEREKINLITQSKN